MADMMHRGKLTDTEMTVGIFCTDRRLARLLILELERCGVTRVVVMGQMTPPEAVMICRLWLVDLDAYTWPSLTPNVPQDPPQISPQNLPPCPVGCMIFCWSKRFFSTQDIAEASRLPWEKVCFVHRPFALSVLEGQLGRWLHGQTPILPSNDGGSDAFLSPTEDAGRQAEEVLSEGDHLLYPVETGMVAVGQTLVSLTGREWALFTCLWERRGRVVSKKILQEKLHALQDGQAPSNAVEVYICHLRRKLEKPTGRRFITTVRGVGYIMNET